MACIHYKFKSTLEFDKIIIEGLHVQLSELKRLIFEKHKISQTAFDLKITHAQTKEDFVENELIARNTTVIVQRIPAANQGKLPKVWDTRNEGSVKRNRNAAASSSDDIKVILDPNATEDDKITAALKESTIDYDPSKYGRSRIMTGPPPPTYTCNKCNQSGHWIANCPMPDMKRSTGIPRHELVETTENDPQAMVSSTTPGKFVVPIMHKEAMLAGKIERTPFVDDDSAEPAVKVPTMPKVDVPPELRCSICSDLLRDAVLIPCCGVSFCDECIREGLLESDGHECPNCGTQGQSPNNLVANFQLRQAIINFLNKTGYAHFKKKAPPPTVVPTTTAEATTSQKQRPPQQPGSISDHHSPVSRRGSKETPDAMSTGVLRPPANVLALVTGMANQSQKQNLTQYANSLANAKAKSGQGKQDKGHDMTQDTMMSTAAGTAQPRIPAPLLPPGVSTPTQVAVVQPMNRMPPPSAIGPPPGMPPPGMSIIDSHHPGGPPRGSSVIVHHIPAGTASLPLPPSSVVVSRAGGPPQILTAPPQQPASTVFVLQQQPGGAPPPQLPVQTAAAVAGGTLVLQPNVAQPPPALPAPPPPTTVTPPLTEDQFNAAKIKLIGEGEQPSGPPPGVGEPGSGDASSETTSKPELNIEEQFHSILREQAERRKGEAEEAEKNDTRKSRSRSDKPKRGPKDTAAANTEPAAVGAAKLTGRVAPSRRSPTDGRHAGSTGSGSRSSSADSGSGASTGSSSFTGSGSDSGSSSGHSSLSRSVSADRRRRQASSRHRIDPEEPGRHHRSHGAGSGSRHPQLPAKNQYGTRTSARDARHEHYSTASGRHRSEHHAASSRRHRGSMDGSRSVSPQQHHSSSSHYRGDYESSSAAHHRTHRSSRHHRSDEAELLRAERRRQRHRQVDDGYRRRYPESAASRHYPEQAYSGSEDGDSVTPPPTRSRRHGTTSSSTHRRYEHPHRRSPRSASRYSYSPERRRRHASGEPAMYPVAPKPPAHHRVGGALDNMSRLAHGSHHHHPPPTPSPSTSVVHSMSIYPHPPDFSLPPPQGPPGNYVQPPPGYITTTIMHAPAPTMHANYPSHPMGIPVSSAAHSVQQYRDLSSASSRHRPRTQSTSRHYNRGSRSRSPRSPSRHHRHSDHQHSSSGNNRSSRRSGNAANSPHQQHYVDPAGTGDIGDRGHDTNKKRRHSRSMDSSGRAHPGSAAPDHRTSRSPPASATDFASNSAEPSGTSRRTQDGIDDGNRRKVVKRGRGNHRETSNGCSKKDDAASRSERRSRSAETPSTVQTKDLSSLHKDSSSRSKKESSSSGKKAHKKKKAHKDDDESDREPTTAMRSMTDFITDEPSAAETASSKWKTKAAESSQDESEVKGQPSTSKSTSTSKHRKASKKSKKDKHDKTKHRAKPTDPTPMESSQTSTSSDCRDDRGHRLKSAVGIPETTTTKPLQAIDTIVSNTSTGAFPSDRGDLDHHTSAIDHYLDNSLELPSPQTAAKLQTNSAGGDSTMTSPRKGSKIEILISGNRYGAEMCSLDTAEQQHQHLPVGEKPRGVATSLVSIPLADGTDVPKGIGDDRDSVMRTVSNPETCGYSTSLTSAVLRSSVDCEFQGISSSSCTVFMQGMEENNNINSLGSDKHAQFDDDNGGDEADSLGTRSEEMFGGEDNFEPNYEEEEPYETPKEHHQSVAAAKKLKVVPVIEDEDVMELRKAIPSAGLLTNLPKLSEQTIQQMLCPTPVIDPAYTQRADERVVAIDLDEALPLGLPTGEQLPPFDDGHASVDNLGATAASEKLQHDGNSNGGGFTEEAIPGDNQTITDNELTLQHLNKVNEHLDRLEQENTSEEATRTATSAGVPTSCEQEQFIDLHHEDNYEEDFMMSPDKRSSAKPDQPASTQREPDGSQLQTDLERPKPTDVATDDTTAVERSDRKDKPKLSREKSKKEKKKKHRKDSKEHHQHHHSKKKEHRSSGSPRDKPEPSFTESSKAKLPATDLVLPPSRTDTTVAAFPSREDNLRDSTAELHSDDADRNRKHGGSSPGRSRRPSSRSSGDRRDKRQNNRRSPEYADEQKDGTSSSSLSLERTKTKAGLTGGPFPRKPITSLPRTDSPASRHLSPGEIVDDSASEKLRRSRTRLSSASRDSPAVSRPVSPTKRTRVVPGSKRDTDRDDGMEKWRKDIDKENERGRETRQEKPDKDQPRTSRKHPTDDAEEKRRKSKHSPSRDESKDSVGPGTAPATRPPPPEQVLSPDCYPDVAGFSAHDRRQDQRVTLAEPDVPSEPEGLSVQDRFKPVSKPKNGDRKSDRKKKSASRDSTSRNRRPKSETESVDGDEDDGDKRQSSGKKDSSKHKVKKTRSGKSDGSKASKKNKKAKKAKKHQEDRERKVKRKNSESEEEERQSSPRKIPKIQKERSRRSGDGKMDVDDDDPRHGLPTDEVMEKSNRRNSGGSGTKIREKSLSRERDPVTITKRNITERSKEASDLSVSTSSSRTSTITYAMTGKLRMDNERNGSSTDISRRMERRGDIRNRLGSPTKPPAQGPVRNASLAERIDRTRLNERVVANISETTGAERDANKKNPPVDDKKSTIVQSGSGTIKLKRSYRTRTIEDDKPDSETPTISYKGARQSHDKRNKSRTRSPARDSESRRRGRKDSGRRSPDDTRERGRDERRKRSSDRRSRDRDDHSKHSCEKRSSDSRKHSSVDSSRRAKYDNILKETLDKQHTDSHKQSPERTQKKEPSESSRKQSSKPREQSPQTSRNGSLDRKRTENSESILDQTAGKNRGQTPDEGKIEDDNQTQQQDGGNNRLPGKSQASLSDSSNSPEPDRKRGSKRRKLSPDASRKRSRDNSQKRGSRNNSRRRSPVRSRKGSPDPRRKHSDASSRRSRDDDRRSGRGDQRDDRGRKRSRDRGSRSPYRSQSRSERQSSEKRRKLTINRGSSKRSRSSKERVEEREKRNRSRSGSRKRESREEPGKRRQKSSTRDRSSSREDSKSRSAASKPQNEGGTEKEQSIMQETDSSTANPQSMDNIMNEKDVETAGRTSREKSLEVSGKQNDKETGETKECNNAETDDKESHPRLIDYPTSSDSQSAEPDATAAPTSAVEIGQEFGAGTSKEGLDEMDPKDDLNKDMTEKDGPELPTSVPAAENQSIPTPQNGDVAATVKEPASSETTEQDGE